MFRAGRELLAGLLLLLSSSCRHFDACGELAPCVSREPAGTGGTGATGGSAGAPSECNARYRDCDQTALNGCETDTDRDRRHCGTCDQLCRGVCASGTCVPYVVERSDLIPHGEMLVTSEFVYFAASRTTSQGVLLQRLTRSDGSVLTLLEDGFGQADALAASPGRVYVVEGSSLFSVPIGGGRFEEEIGAGSVDDISSAGSRIALASAGRVLHRNGDGGDWLSLPGFESASRVLATGSNLVVVETDYAMDATRGPSYRLSQHSFLDEETRPWVVGQGWVSGLYRAVFPETLYFSVKADEDADDAVLYAIEPEQSEPTRIAELVGASRWTIVEGLPSPFFSDVAVLSDYRRDLEVGLRLSMLRSSFVEEWPLSKAPEAFAAEGSDLYFFDTVADELVRIDIEALIAAAVALGPGE